MTADSATQPEEGVRRIALVTRRGERPPWTPAVDPALYLHTVDGSSADGALEAGISDVDAALIDASLGAPLSVARRVHRIAPAAQIVVVAEPHALEDLRRTVMFTPGIGELWLVEPDEATTELVERAASIGRSRQRHTRQTRHLIQRVDSFGTTTDRRVLLGDQYLATLLELLPEPVLALDEDGTLLFANPAAATLLGIESGEKMNGEELSRSLGSPDGLARLLEAGRTQVGRGDIQVRSRTGDRILNLSVAPVTGERPVRAVLLHDVTDEVEARERLEAQATELEAQREAAQAQNEELHAQAEELESQAEELAQQNELNRKLAAEREAVVDNIAEGVVLADADGRVVFMNDAASRIHGTAATGVEPDRWTTAYGLHDVRGEAIPVEELPLMRALREGVPVRDAEWQVRRPDGTRIWAQGSAAPVLDEHGQPLGAVLTVRDVTEQRAREEERERLLSERDRALADLRDAIAERSRFYASMSHELRTPINAIIGYNDLLRTGVYGDVPDNQQEALERIYRAANHLLELINDVLDLSKIEAGKLTLQPEPVRIAEVIADLGAIMRPLAEEHGADLRFSVDDACTRSIMTDPRRLRQILMNLLSNAIRYGGGSPVHVLCSVQENRLRVDVRDRGPGIPEERLGQIFEEFTQLGAPELGGTGLGLPIAQALARLLSGEITVRSAVGHGSTFTVTVPDLADVAPSEPNAAG